MTIRRGGIFGIYHSSRVTTQSQNRERFDRVETHAPSVRFLWPGFVITGVVEHLENDPVATAPGSDFV